MRPQVLNLIVEVQPDAFRQRQALITAANAGDAHAQVQLGHACRTGDEFTHRDYGEALRWYGLAAEQGDPNAQCDLGSMYLNGLGVSKDAEQAVTWFHRAADQGHAVGQFNLALRYLQGDGVEQNDAAAVAWLLMATAQGYIPAITNLGTLCRLGREVPQDFVAAAELHVLAAAAGDPVALQNLSDCRNDLEQIALAGDPSASLSMATIYDRGLGLGQDQAMALAWLRWGKAGSGESTADHVRKGLERLEFEHIIMDTPDVELRAEALLAEMGRSRVSRPS